MKTIILIIFSISWLFVFICQIIDLVRSIREGKFLDARLTYLTETYPDEEYIGYYEFRRLYYSDKEFRKKWSKKRRKHKK